MPLSKTLATGLQRASENLPLLFLLWVANAVFGLAAAVVSGFWLSDALGGSLATRSLARELDVNVFLELYTYHQDSFRMLLVTIGVLAAFYVLLWCWFDAAIVQATGRDQRGSLGDILSRASFDAPVMLRVLVFAWAIQVALTAFCGAAGWLCWRATLASSSEMTVYLIGAGTVALWLLFTTAAVAVHDQARIRACRQHGGARAAYRFALGFVLRRRPGAVRLSAVLLGAAFLPWAVYQGIGAVISTQESLGITGLMIVADVFLLVRMYVRVWSVAAHGELQRRAEG